MLGLQPTIEKLRNYGNTTLDRYAYRIAYQCQLLVVKTVLNELDQSSRYGYIQNTNKLYLCQFQNMKFILTINDSNLKQIRTGVILAAEQFMQRLNFVLFQGHPNPQT